MEWNLQQMSKLLEVVFENAHEPMIVTDKDGKILLLNRSYREFLNVQDVIGKPVTDVIENTRMHIVGQEGVAEIADIQQIKGQSMIAHRIPIMYEGKVLAVLGTVLFQDVKELASLAAMVDQLKDELTYYKKELRRRMGATYHVDQIVGYSQKMQELKQFSQKVAKSDSTVLITGESGTGKELFAHAIHAESKRKMGPFIRVNCAAIPDTLLESELFGYEEGAFTGAVRRGKKGKFELANHGTILLDEIGDMPLPLQAKLLRVLQEKEVEKVGSVRTTPIDVRVIASTNQDMLASIKEGKFRADLYYRLNVVSLSIPPLRERLEDLPELVSNLLTQLVESTGVTVRSIDDDVWAVMRSYSWPGNVRELRNVLERALHLMEDDVLKKEHIWLPAPSEELSNPAVVRPLKETLEQAEREALLHAMKEAGGNKQEAAKLLRISKSTFYEKWEKYRLEKQ
ncbi:sigma 54-interacting transcriptional regulator [Brevibacillus centrosporus]|uniref:sigma-54 interaction domain-containing protein n=1 Tax=Brevibacillus TaxID=55080 RepID=UPI000F0A8C2D|nr:MULTISPECIES: sigma 54-interacting transcriptional regulator [Brevibacillus]MEC2129254.1 sigma 54-interacting transcriptional regulator [Brevibacillus centrosporus]MED1796954.1 sigma 54-interacting transcriptional regulator [Brevibacillus nitrificans]RNB70819.1 PAS domain-containing protein [Brevibacillus centrosporus]GED34310.1 sigma-54-dependent Fis family transcriptional regulator [Brevibacillus centrosporus]